MVPPEKAVPQMVPKAASPIVIDGRPDEAAWQSARVLKDFYQTSPGYNTAPSKPTEVRLLYDDKNLYVAFRCWDDRDQIRSTVQNAITFSTRITSVFGWTRLTTSAVPTSSDSTR